MDMLRQTWAWLVTSSQDPTQYSLALKSALLLFVPKLIAMLAIVCTLGIFCLAVDPGQLQNAIEFVSKAVEIILYIIGGIGVLIGLWRKLVAGQWSHPDAGSFR